MTKQEMIEKIYEAISDKTLSFGCKFADKFHWDNSDDIQYNTIIDREPDYNGTNLINYVPDYAPSVVKFKREDYLFNEKEHYKRTGTNDGENRYNIIGHPIMIGDVLDYLGKDLFYENLISSKEPYKEYEEAYRFILHNWENKRKPIEDQSEECITFIYNLVK